MLNQTVIVGRLVEKSIIEEKENGVKLSKITLAVQRAYKNVNGEYETDMIPVTLWKGVAENTVEYCHKGDLVGIKGRLQTREDKVEIIAEKVTFLSNERKDEE